MRIIPVTGMHRSGTSMVARILNILGVDLGPEGQLLPPADDNPSGFWENVVIKRLNDRVLDAMGGSWRSPPVRPPGWEDDPGLETLRAEARRAIVELGTGGAVVGWKDPRTSLLIPFWRSVAPIDRSVLVLREPTATATSLWRRNELGPEQSAYLWLRYTAAAWHDDPDHVLVDYADLLSSPVSETRRLAAELGLEVPCELDERVRSFVRSDRQAPEPRRRSSAGVLLSLAQDLYDRIAREERHELMPMMRVIAGGWLANVERTPFPEFQAYVSDLQDRLARAQREADRYHTLMAKRIVRFALTISEQVGGARVPRPSDPDSPEL